MAQTVFNRPVSSYVSDSTSDRFIRDVSEWPKVIRRTDTPLVNMIGYSPPPSKPMQKAEWGSSYPDPITDTLSVGIDGSTGTVTPTNIGYYQINDIIQMDSEQMQVTAIGATDLTVTRAFAGTTGAAHVATALLNGILIIGSATSENAETPRMPITLGDTDFNYHRLFDGMLQFSNRAEHTANYEVMDNQLKYHTKKYLQDTLPVDMELTLLRGLRALGTSTTASSMGGVFQPSFSTAVDVAGAPLTEYSFLEAMQSAYMAVGRDNMSRTVMAHPFYKRVFGSWYNNLRRIDGKTSSINTSFDEVDTDFGTFQFVHNHLMRDVANPALPDGRILVADFKDFTLRPHNSEAKWGVWSVYEGGFYKRRALRGDYTLLAPYAEKRTRITSISTDPAQYPSLIAA